VFDAKTLKIKTKAASGVEFNSQAQMAEKDGSVSVDMKTGAKFTHSSGLAINKLEVNTKGRIVGEFSLAGKPEGVTFTVKSEDGAQPPAKEGKNSNSITSKAELGVEYRHKHVVVNASYDAAETLPEWAASNRSTKELARVLDKKLENGGQLAHPLKLAVLGTYEGGLFGANVHYSVGAKSLKAFSAAAGYKAKDFQIVSLNTFGGNDFQFKSTQLTFLHQATADVKWVADLLHKREKADGANGLPVDNPFTARIGAQYALEGGAVLESSVSTVSGKTALWGANYTDKLSKGVKLTLAAQLDMLNLQKNSSEHKLGFTLAFGQ
jgi:hypothetical protein